MTSREVAIGDAVNSTAPQRTAAATAIGIAVLAFYGVAFFVSLAFVTFTTGVQSVESLMGKIHVEPMTIVRFSTRPQSLSERQQHSEPDFDLFLRSPRGSAVEIQDVFSMSGDLLKAQGLWHPGATVECALLRGTWTPAVSMNAFNAVIPLVLIGLASGFHLFGYFLLGWVGYKPVKFGDNTRTFSLSVGRRAPVGGDGPAMMRDGPLNGTWRAYLWILGGLFALIGVFVLVSRLSRFLLHVTLATGVFTLSLYLAFALFGALVFAALASKRP